MAVPKPTINGNRVAWSSVEIKVAAQRILGVKNVSFKDTSKPGSVRGTHQQRIGKTPGDLESEGSIELYNAEAELLLVTLGDGYMEVEFDIFIAYRAKNGGGMSKRELRQCQISGIDESHSQSTEALTTKFDLDIGHIVRNGLNPLKQMLGPGF